MPRIITLNIVSYGINKGNSQKSTTSEPAVSAEVNFFDPVLRKTYFSKCP